MNRYNYLNALSNIIQNELPADEYNNVMQYYSEYFADAGADKEQEVIASLGTPEELARGIIAEQCGREPDEIIVRTKRRGLPLGWIIAIAIVGSPIWLALLCVGIAVGACVVAIAITVVVVALVFVLVGVVLVIGGIGKLFTVPGDGLVALGLGFIIEAAGIALAILIIALIRLIVTKIGRSKAKKREGRI